MELQKQGAFTKKPTDLPDVPSPTYSPDEIKSFFQTPVDELTATFNKAIDDLNVLSAQPDNVLGIQEKLYDHDTQLADIGINIKSFGAKLDGVTDDASALRSAVSYIESNVGTKLYIPEGVLFLKTMTVDALTNVFVKLISNLTVYGAGKGKSIIKVDGGLNTSNGGLQSIFGKFDSTLIENIHFYNLTFDLNGQNNLQPSGYEYFNGAIIARKAKNVLIHDCEFKNCAGMQLTAFGFDSNDDAQNIRILNNDYYEVSDSITGNNSTDHSSVYVVGNDVVITGNRFINANRSSHSTAIEADGHNHFISNNYAYRYNIAVLSGSWSTYTVDGQEISGNIGRDILTGVMIYCNTEGNYKNVKIHHNLFQLADGTYVNIERYGIDALTNVSARILDVDIYENQIFTIENYSSLVNGYQSGIGVRSAKKLKVNKNKFNNLGGLAVYVITLNSGVDTDDIDISDNDIWNICQKHASGYNSAISLQALTNILNIKVDNNRIENKNFSTIINGIQLQGTIKGNIRKNDVTNVTTDFQTVGVTFGSSNLIIEHKTKNQAQDFRNLNCHKGSFIEVLSSGSWYNSNKYFRRIDGYFNMEYGHTSPPATGSYIQGDIVYNNNPTSGSFEKWICVASGSPGTWKGVGQIQA